MRVGVRKIIKRHWILLFSACLLIILSVPFFYYNTVLLILDRRSGRDSKQYVESIGPQIGIVINSLGETRWFEEKEIWEKKADQLNLKIQFRVADNSPQRQKEQIYDLVRKKVRVLILVPVEVDGLEDVLTEASEKGTKIIMYDDLTKGPVDLYMGFDYKKVGELQARILTDHNISGNYLLFEDPKETWKNGEITRGREKILCNTNQGSEITEVMRVKVEPASPGQAVLTMKNILAKTGVDAILTLNDLTAGEIIRLFQDQKLPVPSIVGVGAEKAAWRRVRDGSQLGTVSIDYRTLAEEAFNNAALLAEGKEITGPHTVRFGNRIIPARLFEVNTVTAKSNR